MSKQNFSIEQLLAIGELTAAYFLREQIITIVEQKDLLAHIGFYLAENSHENCIGDIEMVSHRLDSFYCFFKDLQAMQLQVN